MAWRNNSRLSHKHLKGMFRKWRLPSRPENPRGIPRAIMKVLQQEQLPADAINGRLQELLKQEQ